MTVALIDYIFITAAGVFLATAASAIETALSVVSSARVEQLAKEKTYGSAQLLKMLPNRIRYVNLLTAVWVISATFSTIFSLTLFLQYTTNDNEAVLADTVIMAVINYFLIGMGSRVMGRRHAYLIACITARPVSTIAMILVPIVDFLIWAGNIILPGSNEKNPSTSEVELREIVELAQAGGTLDDQEFKMISAVFDLGSTNARSVMVPRTEMIWIENHKSIPQVLSLAERSGFSRIPVIGEDLDDIQGVVYIKDILTMLFPENSVVDDVSKNISDVMGKTVADIMRPAQFLPDTKLLDSVLQEMQANHTHMAILVNEYGSIAGLVTFEDIFEEIIGEISDEHDRGQIPPIEEYEPGKYRVSTRFPLENLSEILDIDFDTEEVDTVGGLVALTLGRVPLPGVQINEYGLIMRTEGGRDRRGRIKVMTVLIEHDTTDDQ